MWKKGLSMGAMERWGSKTMEICPRRQDWTEYRHPRYPYYQRAFVIHLPEISPASFEPSRSTATSLAAPRLYNASRWNDPQYRSYQCTSSSIKSSTQHRLQQVPECRL